MPRRRVTRTTECNIAVNLRALGIKRCPFIRMCKRSDKGHYPECK